jgi:hypothetical protein
MTPTKSDCVLIPWEIPWKYHGKYHGNKQRNYRRINENKLEIGQEIMINQSVEWVMIIPKKPLKKQPNHNPSIVGFGSEASPKVTEIHSNKLVHK